MKQRDKALAIMCAGIACDVVAHLSAIRQTWLNFVLTLASMALIAVGLVQLWRTRGGARGADA